MRNRNNRHGSIGRSRKYGVKDENIDRQILVLHRAMGVKLINNPMFLQQAQDNLDTRHNQGNIAYGAYLTWSALLELSVDPDKFMTALLEDSPKMRRLRRNTPFIGLLTEQERQDALAAEACGEVDISSLL